MIPHQYPYPIYKQTDYRCLAAEAERDLLRVASKEWHNLANEALELAEKLCNKLHIYEELLGQYEILCRELRADNKRKSSIDRIGPYVVEDAQKPVRGQAQDAICPMTSLLTRERSEMQSA